MEAHEQDEYVTEIGDKMGGRGSISAFSLGEKAYRTGIKVSAKDPRLISLIKKADSVNAKSDLMQKWNAGWIKAQTMVHNKYGE